MRRFKSMLRLSIKSLIATWSLVSRLKIGTLRRKLWLRYKNARTRPSKCFKS